MGFFLVLYYSVYFHVIWQINSILISRFFSEHFQSHGPREAGLCGLCPPGVTLRCRRTRARLGTLPSGFP